MIDIEFLIETGIIPDEIIIEKEFGAFDYEIYDTALVHIDTKTPPLEYATALIVLGELFEENHKYRVAADCYAFAATFNVPLAYQLLINVLKNNTPNSRFYDPELALCSIPYFEYKLNKLQKYIAIEEKSESKTAESASSKDMTASALVVVDTPLKSLLDKIKTPMIMAERLDLMYEILTSSIQLRKKIYTNKAVKDSLIEIGNMAKQFVETLLDTDSEEKVTSMMQERLKKRSLDPEFIPGLKPRLTSFIDPLAYEGEDARITMHWRKLTELVAVKKQKKIMPMTVHGIEADTLKKTKYLTPLERDPYRVVIKDGQFYHLADHSKFQLFNTIAFLSHNKFTFGAYTINLNGELSVFTHLHMNEKATPYAHSTMSKGQVLFGAGEIKIIKGKLTTLTIHSGHYEPDVENIYHILDYFKSKNVNISKVKVHFFEPLVKYPQLDYKYDKKMPTQPYVYNAESLHAFFHKRNLLVDEKEKDEIKLVDDKKEDEQSKWHIGNPTVTAMVRTKKTECLDRINEILLQYPEHTATLNQLKININLINPKAKNAARELTQLSALILPAIQENVYNYLLTLSRIAAKFPSEEIKQSFQKLLVMEQSFMDVDTSYKKYPAFMKIMNSSYNEAKVENRKLNISLKKYLAKSITELRTEIKNCLKTGFRFWRYEPSTSILKDILGRLDTLLRKINQVKTDVANGIVELDNHYIELTAIFSELKKPSNQDQIKETVSSQPKFQSLLTKWSEKLQPLESKADHPEPH